MKYFAKVADFDVSEINHQLAEQPGLWGAHQYRRRPGSPHMAMRDIWVRYNDVRPYDATGDYTGFNEKHIPIWYPAWKALPALRPIVFSLMAMTEGEMLGAVLITRIPPGGRIDRHVDKSWHVDYYDKLYVSLRSAPGATFHCGDETINPKTGETWLFDNRDEHWVVNDSDQDRVTLIVCIRTEKYGRQDELPQW